LKDTLALGSNYPNELHDPKWTVMDPALMCTSTGGQ